MKKILLGLLFICTAVEASKANLPNGERTSSQKSAATTQAVTADDLLHMHKYFKSTYYQLIEDLRENQRVSRDDILSAYAGDPFLKRAHDGGHGTFVHTFLPLKVGVIAHGSGDVNVGERQGHHQKIQVYVNVIGNFSLTFLNIHHAIAALDTMSPAEWQQTYGAKLNEAVHAFNAMTSVDWNARVKAEEAAFEEYSRD